MPASLLPAFLALAAFPTGILGPYLFCAPTPGLSTDPSSTPAVPTLQPGAQHGDPGAFCCPSAPPKSESGGGHVCGPWSQLTWIFIVA